MQDNEKNFAIIERIFERRLKELGLSPHLFSDGVFTGYDGFELHRHDAKALEVQPSPFPKDHYFASIEIKAGLRRPAFGEVEIFDLITMRGDSFDGVLTACANAYMDVTFPALQSLFEMKAAPGAMRMTMSVQSPSSNAPVLWNVFAGGLQIVGDPHGRLSDRFDQFPPIAMALDALTGYCANPGLHWCKMYGAMSSRGLVFGCSIDGAKSQEAEEEMREKFLAGGDPPEDWEFRQFFTMLPAEGGERT